METTLRLEDVQKTYRAGLFHRPVSVLKGLSLRAGPGEVYALIGPNGAGKTTTFRVLLGLVPLDAGDGSVLGWPLGHMEARRRLGFLPEAPCYYPYLTVRELLRLAGRLSGMPEVERGVDRSLERFRLGPLRDRLLRRLSKGQLQHVGIAQACMHDPPLLILDEPMSGLDPIGRADVKGWIREMREEGKTVVLASHVLADVEALADRVGLLHDGRIAIEGTSEDLLQGSEQEAEIEFSCPGDPADLIRGISAVLEPRAGLWAAVLAGSQEIQVSALLSRILSHGGTVRSVHRRRKSLEGLLIETVRQSAGEVGR
jgi:ABC-2 type transport system ATP-binding protein